MLPKLDHTPILVVVSHHRYDMYSLSAKPTKRDAYLKGVLRKMGGVNESVSPGRYYFNVKRTGLLKLEVTLDPAD